MSSTAPPKISIVTPSLNQGRFLQDCINSVRAQEWPRVEHFIIDGGSVDDTMEVIWRNDGWLTGYLSEPDKGAADAINKGIGRCTGDIVAWLNADDFYLPGAFTAVADAYQTAPKASFWFGNGVRTDVDGTVTAVFNDGSMAYDHSALVEGLDYILQPATFMNRSFLQEVGCLDAGLHWGFDWDLWIRLAKLAPPYPIDCKLAASREWGDTLTATGGFRRVEELRLLAEAHSGNPMTVGTLCYWLDTFTKHLRDSQEIFGDGTLIAAQQLWREAQKDLRRLGVSDNGSPIVPAVKNDACKATFGDRLNFFMLRK